MSARPPHPSNVPGDFYVEDGCCTMCGIPNSVAGDLFSVDDEWSDTHCFVSKQPESPAELDRMIEAISWSEFNCIRYRGASLATQVRIVDLALGEQCDQLLPELVRRNAEMKRAQRRRVLLQRWKRRIADFFVSLRGRGVRN